MFPHGVSFKSDSLSTTVSVTVFLLEFFVAEGSWRFAPENFAAGGMCMQFLMGYACAIYVNHASEPAKYD